MRTVIVPLLLLAALLVSIPASAKPTPAPSKVEVKRRPTRVDEVDALRLRAAAAELAEQIARRDAARVLFDAAERSIGPASDEYASARRVFEVKYGLDPAHDKFDTKTLEIQWATPEPAARKGGAL